MTPDEFVSQVVYSYKNSKGVFSNKINAEELVPSKLTELGKGLYLFYVIQLDYATKSQRLYEGAKKLYAKEPSFFEPKTIVGLSNSKLENYLKKYLKPRYINEAVKRYKINSEKLAAEYGGDSKNIFTESKTAKQALKKVLAFRGFGPKIGNFYVRTMINVFEYNYPDIEDIMPPVDVHDVKIAYLMGFIDSKKMSKKNISRVKKLWHDACKKTNESWLIFDKALWLLGSEGLPKTKEDVLVLIE